MRHSRQRKIGKKALSEMIAYVLLIVIAMSLSILVYAWLKGYIFKPEKKCPDGVSLMIEELSCNQNADTITLTLKNNGLFNIKGFTARVKEYANKPSSYYLKKDDNRLIDFSDYTPSSAGLAPNKAVEAGSFSYTNQIQKIEIQPIINDSKGAILCENIYSQSVSNCN